MVTVIDSGVADAQQLMDRDAQMLSELEGSDAIVHHYQWNGPSATYGHFIKPSDHLQMDAVAKVKLNLAQRATGGGIIFHLTDLAFSILLPVNHPRFSQNTMTNYATVNQVVCGAVEAFCGGRVVAGLLPQEPTPLDMACKHFCMAKPTRYDVVVDGQKVGGAAQRRTRLGLLHHGSISLVKPPQELLERVLRQDTRVVEAMGMNSRYLVEEEGDLGSARVELRRLLVQYAQEGLGL